MLSSLPYTCGGTRAKAKRLLQLYHIYFCCLKSFAMTATFFIRYDSFLKVEKFRNDDVLLNICAFVIFLDGVGEV